MTARPLLTLVALAIVAACGGDTSSADTTNGSSASTARTSDDRSSAARASSDQERSATPADDRCSEVRFDDTVPFAFHDELPFRFEVPAGWDHLDSSNPSQIAGSVAFQESTGRRSSTRMIQYVFGREPLSSSNVMLDVFRQSMEQVGTVTMSGEEVEVFGHGVPGVVNAKFLFPDDGGWRQASFIFGASSTSCLPERRRVRDLVLGSLADRR